MDNISWNEQPMVRDLRQLGLCEGVRWWYQDSLCTQLLEDWEAQPAGGVVAIRFKIQGGTAWLKPCFWQVRRFDMLSPQQVHLRRFEAEERRILSHLAGALGSPSAAQWQAWKARQKVWS